MFPKPHKNSVPSSFELSKNDLNYINRYNPPSIPSGDFVYGYEETELPHVLILKIKPKDIISGNQGDSVGPGHYDFEPISRRNKAGTNWHTSKTVRELLPFKKIDNYENVGPGAYELSSASISLNTSMHKSPRKLNKITKIESLPKLKTIITDNADFVVHRKRNSVQTHIGSGYYEIDKSKLIQKAKPDRYQFFGSSVERFPENKKGIEESQIGPGFYTKSLDTKQFYWIKNGKIANKKSVAFGVSDQRFLGTKSLALDFSPNNFESETISKKFSIINKHSKGAFGSWEKRFPKISISSSNNSIGPGSYNPDKK